MNWILTPAQQRQRRFAALSVAEVLGEGGAVRGGNGSRPRLTDMALLEFVAARFREVERTPTYDDLGGRRQAIARRFGGVTRAYRKAAELLLTAEEREAWLFRCEYCGAGPFRSLKALAGHQQIHWRKK